MVTGLHGVTANTPENILLGAGTYHKGLKWNADTSSWEGECIGATSGGGKIAIAGEFVNIEIDGMLVKTKGFTIKAGGTVTAEVNFIELSKDMLKVGALFEEGVSDVEGFTMMQDKANIEAGDYLDNFGFVGFMADGKTQIVVIFESALCTSGIELEPKAKEASVVKLSLEAYAENQGNLNTLPVKIYYPNATT